MLIETIMQHFSLSRITTILFFHLFGYALKKKKSTDDAFGLVIQHAVHSTSRCCYVRLRLAFSTGCRAYTHSPGKRESERRYESYRVLRSWSMRVVEAGAHTSFLKFEK
jgi:hypothetical protein